MVEEQTKNNNEAVETTTSASDKAADRKYERSTIEFPYLDLGDAVEIVRAIHSGGGLSCPLDKIAAEVGQSMTSGAFRLRVSNARVFGLTENDRGESRLTELGRLVVDPDTEPHGRAESFLRVPLYKAIFDQYKGFTLPPAAALEREMVKLGVSSKQADKARQAFMRSARQAGFFAYGEDKLIRPTTSAGPGTKPITDVPEHVQKGQSDGGGDGGGLNLDPLLIELLRKIPPSDEGWPGPKRVRWFRTFAMNVSQIFDGDNEPVEIKMEIQEHENAQPVSAK